MAYGRPEPDPPPGPVRELVEALRELHARAGLPSRRKISHDIRQRHDLRDTVSHETVSAMLRGDTRPSWLKYETVVRYLAEFAVYQPDEKVPDHTALLARFHRLWLACEEDNDIAAPEHTPSPTPPPEPDSPPPKLIDEVGGDPPPRNPRFVGREHQIRAVHEVGGDKHAAVLLASRVRVMALRKLGRTAEALSLARENHQDTTLWFGADHEYTLAAGLSLVNALLAAGDLGNATIEASNVLSGCERVFGATHPVTLAMLVDSAAVHRALGNVPEARRRDERAATELSRALGDGHPYTSCARHNLAIDLAVLGFEGRALDELKAVRDDSDRGDTHPDHLACEIDIALARIAIGGPAAGQQSLAEATAALEAQLGARHPDVVAAKDQRWIGCDIEPPAT